MTEEHTEIRVGYFVALAVSIIIAILALYYASHSLNTSGYSLGMAIFGLFVAVAFWLIKRMADTAAHRTSRR